MRLLPPLLLAGAILACGESTSSSKEGPGSNPAADAGGVDDAGLGQSPWDAGEDAGPAQTVPLTLSIHTATVMETEPSLAVAPNGYVAVVWLGKNSRGYSLGYAFSQDWGDTFDAPQLVTLSNGRFAGNATVVADSNSVFHLSVLAVSPADHSGLVLEAAAGAGDVTFGPLAEASPAGQPAMRDAPSLVVSNDNSLSIVYSEGAVGAQALTAIQVAHNNNGNTWTTTALLENQACGWPAACADSTGAAVAVVYVSSASDLAVRVSLDHGNTWPALEAASLSLPFNFGEFPSCVVRGNNLWVLQGRTHGQATSTTEPTLSTITMFHSGDLGASFDPPVAAQDSAAGDRYMRAAAWVDGEGLLSLVYYAGNSDGDPLATLRRSRSSDLGHTFGPSQELYAPLVLTTSRVGRDWLGDLLGVAHDGTHSMVSWVNNSSGSSHIMFMRLRP